MFYCINATDCPTPPTIRVLSVLVYGPFHSVQNHVITKIVFCRNSLDKTPPPRNMLLRRGHFILNLFNDALLLLHISSLYCYYSCTYC